VADRIVPAGSAVQAASDRVQSALAEEPMDHALTSVADRARSEVDGSHSLWREGGVGERGIDLGEGVGNGVVDVHLLTLATPVGELLLGEGPA